MIQRNTSVEVNYDDLPNQLDVPSNEEGKQYKVKLLIVRDRADFNKSVDEDEKGKSREFFIAEEQYSDEEIVKLTPYCRCSVCSASIFSLIKYCQCRCCVGCLRTTEGGEDVKRNIHHVVRETRKYYELKQAKQSAKNNRKHYFCL